MGMPPVCNCLCDPADGDGSSSSSGSLFNASGCGCTVHARAWRITATATDYCSGFINDITVYHTQNCVFTSGCLNTDDPLFPGNCCFKVDMIFTNTGPGSGGVEIFYIGRDGYTRYRFAESATNLGLTTPGSCVGTFSIPLVDDNISRFLCCAWDFFLGPPASVTISPA